jgi:hypothetical protein
MILSEIRIKLKTRIKTETKYGKMMKQHPNMSNILQETKTKERKRISKVDTKHTRLRRVKSEFET